MRTICYTILSAFLLAKSSMVAQTLNISLLKDVARASANGSSFDNPGTVWNGKYYFSAHDATNGNELWVTDGTSAGTQLLKDINPGASGSDCRNYYVVGNQILFTAATAATGMELWRTDGTAAGTVLVKDIWPGVDGSTNTASSGNENRLYAVFNGKLYFSANDGTTLTQLWASDGTEAGTSMVKQITGTSFNNHAFPDYLTVYKNKLYFQATLTGKGKEPWITDGTEAGTVILKDVATGSANSFASDFTECNGHLLFLANSGNLNIELFRTDGTEAGTELVMDIRSGAFSGFDILGINTYDNRIFVIDTIAYFAANDGLVGAELWRSNGTTAGTFLVKDANAGSSSFPLAPQSFSKINKTLLYRYETTAAGDELWKSDGTASGTQLVKDIYAGSGGSMPYEAILYEHKGNIFFDADNNTGIGREMHVSDGTTTGTKLVKELNPGFGDADSYGFATLGDDLIFFARGTDAKDMLFILKIVQPLVSAGTVTGTILCNGDKTASITTTVTGGVTPYTYNWSVAGQTGSALNNIGAGTYKITVTDAASTTSVKTFTVTQPPVLNASTTATPSVIGQSNGTVVVTPTGGTSPYSYAWTPITLPPTASIADLPGGNYVVTITDQNGCTLVKTIVVNEIVSTENLTAKSTAIFPNPATHSFQISLSETVGVCQITIFDPLMRPIFSTKNSQNITVKTTDWSSGMYYIRVQPLASEAQVCWKNVVIKQ